MEDESVGEPMPAITIQPSLVDQVVDAIVSEIVEGELPSNMRLIQEDLARSYGVSRQPVQQALRLLRNQGLVREAPGRGLIVAPLDVDFVRNLYEVRAALEGLAARLAAQRGATRAKSEGPNLIEKGYCAVEEGSLGDQIEADMAFHAFVADLSGNALIGETTVPHWPYLRRVMAAVLREDSRMPTNIWAEHAAILKAISEGDEARAESLSREHLLRASDLFIGRLEARMAPAEQRRVRTSGIAGRR